jgi:hypothetical protein
MQSAETLKHEELESVESLWNSMQRRGCDIISDVLVKGDLARSKARFRGVPCGAMS